MEVEIDPSVQNAERLKALLEATAKAEGKHPSRVSVEFVDVRQMADLNRKYRERSRPTDVLSFPFDGSFPQGSGGQIVICLEEAERGASASKRTLIAEVERLVVHGMLHLLGHTDDTPERLADMERRTDAVLGGENG